MVRHAAAAAVLCLTFLSGGIAARAQAPPPESLPIRVSPEAATVRRGDVMSLLVEVQNQSDIALTREAAGGGVALQMHLPDGFAWVDKSGRIEVVGSDPVRALDPAPARAEPRMVADADGSPETLSLVAGGVIRFRFQIAAASPTKPFYSGTLRVWLTSSDGTRLSADATARVRVEADPESDLSLVLGTVFCDDDGDRHRDEGEPGLGGVRLVSDDGRAVDSDRDGRFHLRDLRPGAHVVKLDVHTVPPGSTLSTPERALLDLTPGTPARAEFGVKCKLVTTGPTEVDEVDGGPVEVPPFSAVAGSVDDFSMTVDGRDVPGRKATLGVETELMTKEGRHERVRATNRPWRPGALDRPITFALGITGDMPSAQGASWRLDVAALGDGGRREVVRTFHGKGTPPTSIQWDGMDGETAVGVLRRGGLHEARLAVADGKGDVIVSAPVLIGASAGTKVAEVSRVEVRGNLFDKAEMPTGTLLGALTKALARAKKVVGARLLVEVHVGATAVEQSDLIKTRRGAYNVADYLKRKSGLSLDRIISIGYGGLRPLRPNVGARNQAFNTRVEIVVLTPEDAKALPPIDPKRLESKPLARVQGEEVPLDPDGRFVTPVAHAEVIAVTLEGADGARRTVAIGATAQPPDAKPTLNPDGTVFVPDDDKDKKPEQPAGPDAAAEAIAKDPLRRFGGQPLKDALGPGAAVATAPGETATKPATAQKIEVTLPEKGATLEAPRVFVRGKAHPKNAITINGAKVRVATDGTFGELVQLSSAAAQELVIVSTDAGGHTARVKWPLAVAQTEVFVLALVDGVGGQLGARLEELDGYEKTANADLFLAGRGALYAKARVSGSALAKDIFVTAHVDTQHKQAFEPFFEQVIDPARDYVIFGDASDDVRDANARGPFYLKVEADRSSLMYGNFRTGIEGLHLMRYDRAFEGAKLDVDATAEPGWRTRAKVFVADDNRRLVRRHDELRATGGSLYYTSVRDMVEGSDQVSLVVREMDTGVLLARAPLTRDVHYRIDYPSGRIMAASPIPSVVDALFAIDGFQPFTNRSILDGHAVYLEVDYESRAAKTAGDLAYGIQVVQEIAGRVELGGGIVREGRPDVDKKDADYLAYHAQAAIKLGDKSRVYGEWAATRQSDGATQVSTDGGLRYRALDRAPDDTKGQAFALGVLADVGELAGDADLGLVFQAHWQMLEAGFQMAGSARDEGTERWGADLAWQATDRTKVRLAYDAGTTLIGDAAFDGGLRGLTRNRFSGRVDHRVGPADLYGELTFGQHRDDDDGKAFSTTGGAIGTRVRLGKVALLVSQEALFGGDDAILGKGTNERLTTNAGIEVALGGDLALRLGESLRWNGDNATRLGLVSQVDEHGRVYMEERLEPGTQNGRLASALVVGGETALSEDGTGRAYGEYRLDGGVGGRANEAVVGVGKTFEVVPGVRASVGYERSQSLLAQDLDPAGGGAGGSRDVLSGGLAILVSDVVKFGGLYELRYDRDRPGEAAPEMLQALSRNTLALKLGPDLTFFGNVDYTLSQDLDSRRVLREDLEATGGIAVRPMGDDDLVVLGRYSRVASRRSDVYTSLLGDAVRSDARQAANVISLAAIIALPGDFSITEKLAWRFTTSSATGLPEGHEDELLWINRLAWEILEGLELAGEFRLVASLGDLAIEKNGGLVELGYTIMEHARLGVGWSIDGLAGGLLPGEEASSIDNGLFVRLTGMY